MNKNRYSIAYLTLLMMGVGCMTTAIVYSIDLEGFCENPHHCLQIEAGERGPSYIGKGNPHSVMFTVVALFFILGAMLPAKLEEIYVKEMEK